MGSSSGRKHPGGIPGASLTREARMRHAATRMTTTALVALVLLTPAASHATTASWTVVSSVSPSKDNNTLYGVAALSSTDVWAVGDLNTGVIPTVTGRRTLIGVTAISSTDIWAVGSASACHFDGTSWTLARTPDPSKLGAVAFTLLDVSASASNVVWSAGFASYQNGEGITTGPLVESWNG